MNRRTREACDILIARCDELIAEIDRQPAKSAAVLEFEAQGGVVKKCPPGEARDARFDGAYDSYGYFSAHAAGLWTFVGITGMKPKNGRA